jgi:hypothetical protein
MFFNCCSPDILEGDIEPVVHVFLHPAGNKNHTGLRQRLQACRHVHAVAMYAATVDNDVSDVDPHSKLDPCLWRHFCIPLDHSALDLDSAT